MKLSAIRVHAFRQFRSGVHVTNLDAGLNIFHGPNESGKSTLAHAIRVAFLERHSAGTHHDLQPWGDSSASPEVHIDFVYNGRRHQLSKQFVRTKRCDLRIDTQSLTGEEAEQYLAGMMGFSMPARGTSRPENWGVPGLLWIEQGEGHHLHRPVEYAHQQLQGVLGDALGQVASSDGDRVLHAVQQRLEALQTRAGAPRGNYRQAVQEQEETQAQLNELDARVQHYRDEVDNLAQLQARFSSDASEQPWREMRRQESEAREKLAQAQAMRDQLAQHRASLQASLQTQTLLRQQLDTYRERKESLAARRQALSQAQEHADALSLQTPLLQAAVQDATHAYTQARATLEASRRVHTYREKRQQLANLQTEVARLEQQRKQAEAVLRTLETDQKRAATLNVDKRELHRLQALHEQLQALEIRQETIATRLQFDLLEGQSLELGNDRISGQSERLLLDATVLKIPGVGSLRITPGGEDVADLARERERVTHALQSGLQALQADNFQQLQQRAIEHDALATRIRQHQALLAVHAPDGMAALERQRSELATRVHTLQRECADLDTPAPDSLPDVATAQQTEQLAERHLKQAQAKLQDHHVSIATARAAVDAARRECDVAASLADSPDNEKAEQDTLRQLYEERARAASLEHQIAQLEGSINAVRPEMLEQDIARFGRSATQMQEEHAERARTIREMKGRLQAWGAQGLEEQQRTLQSRLAALERRVADFGRQVRALALLHELLSSRRQALTRELHEPLRRRMMHYLDVLFGGSDGALDVVLGDGLMPVGLTRNDTQAALDALSFGAREQMGLVTRLAYADLLKEASQPTLIMLDDALVHTDATRLAHMKRILYDAADRHQILLFTCHPEKWRDMGVTPRAMRDLLVS